MRAHLFIAALFAALTTCCAANPVVRPTTCHSSVLTSPTAITAYENGVATKNYTESSKMYNQGIVLPFNVGVAPYRRKDVLIYFAGAVRTDAYDATYGSQWNIYFLEPYSITKGLDQGIFYSIEGKAPQRTANIEWRLGSPKFPGVTWHFGLQWYEADPALTRFKYWHIPTEALQREIDVEYYKTYYADGPTNNISSGDVLQFRNFKPGYSNTRFYRGPRNACQYQEGVPEFDEAFFYPNY